MAEFHWVGSTAGNIDSLRWGNVSNWRVIALGVPGSTAPGGTLARLIPATRLPLGSADFVYFGCPTWWQNTTASQYEPSRYNVQSPCLFGGVTTAAVKVWEGSTAGTSIASRHGLISIHISPRYPFSRLGGYVDFEILNEWKNYTNALYGTVFNGWTLASGTEYDNAQYTTVASGGTLAVWHGISAGFTGGISFAQQTSYTLRCRGLIHNMGHERTVVSVTGFTGATAGATGSYYDGSWCRINIQPHLSSAPNGFAGNRSGEGFTGQEFSTNLGDVIYNSSSMICSGHWNEIMSKDFSTKKSNISLEGAVVNGLVLRPTRTAQYTFNASTNQYTGLTIGFITSPATSNFEVGNVYIDETSSLKFVQIGNVKRHSSDAEITVLGDITASGGFVCAIPAGASASGASGGVVYPGGSLVVESPAENAAGDENGAIVNLGFNQYDGSTKATTEITGVHLLQNTSTPMTVILTGPITSETVNLHGGVLKKGERLERTAPVNINSLNLHGNAVYDISSNSEHSLGTVKVNGLSNASSVKLGIGTALTVGHVNGVAPVSV